MDSEIGDQDGRKRNGSAVDRPADLPTAFIDARALIGCRHRLRLDAAHPEALTGITEDAGVRQRRDAAAAHRGRVRDALIAAAPDSWVVIDPQLRAVAPGLLSLTGDATDPRAVQNAFRRWLTVRAIEPNLACALKTVHLQLAQAGLGLLRSA